MRNLTVNVQDADLGLTNKHKFAWNWRLSDIKANTENKKTVFSCFSCGGGSSMGYKLAGFDVIGNCEIDAAIIDLYRENFHPKHSYHMDIREFEQLPLDEIPDELLHLDILDGSPPCSVFSMAGQREKYWGKAKAFREGQKHQRLDDLFFPFIHVAEKLKPKVVVAENVKGLIQKNAKGYMNEIIKEFNHAGYSVQIFLLNAAKMGVPQRRERVFVIGHRKDLDYPRLKLSFNEDPILFGEVRSKTGKAINPESKTFTYLKYMKPTDKSVKDIKKRLYGKESNFNDLICQDDEVMRTVTANGQDIRGYDKMMFSDEDYRNVQTFPQDYNFKNQSAKYICGMSVPPVMMAQIAASINEQWLSGSEMNGK